MLDQPQRERVFNIPAVVLLLVGALGLIHAVLVLALTPRQTTEALLLFAFIPARYDPNALAAFDWPGGAAADVWTFATYALLHGDLNHLIFNCIWLLAFGSPVARRFGPWRFLAFFAATAVAGAAVHLATHFGELLPMIGASAAISGAMAAAMRFAFQRGGPLGLWATSPDAYKVPAATLAQCFRDPRVLAFLLVWFGLNALLGLSVFTLPGMEHAVAWQAHIGGFLVGLFAFRLFDPVPSGPPAGAPDIADNAETRG
jgi:membrane associated rhomboid family serine protease